MLGRLGIKSRSGFGLHNRRHWTVGSEGLSHGTHDLQGEIGQTAAPNGRERRHDTHIAGQNSRWC